MKKEHFYIVESETYIELMKTDDILEIPLDATIIEAEDTSSFMPDEVSRCSSVIDTITLSVIPGTFFNPEYSLYLGQPKSMKSPLKPNTSLVPRLYRAENLKLHTTEADAESVLFGISRRANTVCIDSRTNRNPIDCHTTGFRGGLIFRTEDAIRDLQPNDKGVFYPFLSDGVLELLRPVAVQKNLDIIKSYIKYFSEHNIVDASVFSDIDCEYIADSILIDDVGNRSKVYYNKICNTESGERLFFSIVGPAIYVTMLSPTDMFNKLFLRLLEKGPFKSPAQLDKGIISKIKSIISPDVSSKFSSSVNIKLIQPQKKEEKRLFLKDLKKYNLYDINAEIKKLYSSLKTTREHGSSGRFDNLIDDLSISFVNKYLDCSSTMTNNIITENIATVVSSDATLVAKIEEYKSLQTTKFTTIRRALFNEIRNQLGMTKKGEK